MQKLTVLFIVLFITLLISPAIKLCTAQAPASVPVGLPEKKLAKINAIEAALEKSSVFELVDCPLTELPEVLDEKLKIQVTLDRKALLEAKIDADEGLINIDIKGISYRSALAIMLRELNLGYVIHNEVLIITTKKGMTDPKFLQTRIYDVKDLVEYEEEVFDSPKKVTAADFDQLIDLIRSSILPDTWKKKSDKATGTATIVPYKNKQLKVLVVNHNIHGHRKIENLLAKLRQLQKSNRNQTVELEN